MRLELAPQPRVRFYFFGGVQPAIETVVTPTFPDPTSIYASTGVRFLRGPASEVRLRFDNVVVDSR